MGYVDEAVTSAKIPTIKGSKEWGTYQIHGIKIKKIHITEDTLDVAITKVVTIVRSATPLTERCPTARETASDGVCLQTVSPSLLTLTSSASTTPRPRFQRWTTAAQRRPSWST